MTFKQEFKKLEFLYFVNFEKQIFINLEELKNEISKIPESFLIHNNIQYKIFSSIDKVEYFLCKQKDYVINQYEIFIKTININ